MSRRSIATAAVVGVLVALTVAFAPRADAAVGTADTFGPFGSVKNYSSSTASVRAYDNRYANVRYDTRLCSGTYRMVAPGTQTSAYYDADCLRMRTSTGRQVTGIVTVINVLTGERKFRWNAGCNRGSLNDYDVGFNGLERALVEFARPCP